MEIHGSLNLLGNQLKQACLEMEGSFPSAPQPGRLLFREEDRTLYICASIDDGLPLWVPCARIRDMHRHTQGNSALEWVVDHNLNMNPVLVQVYDEAGNWVIPDEIVCTSPNRAIVRFLTPMVGHAVVLRGEVQGITGLNVAYTQTFASSTTWVVTHGLGYNPAITVYVNGAVVQPSSIVHDNDMQCTVTFSGPRAGSVICS